MSIQAVIFDLGGVLVRTEDRTPRQQLATRLGMSYTELSQLIFDSPSARLATLGQINTQEHWENVRKSLGLSPAEFPEVPLAFWGGDILDAQLVNYIDSLRPKYKTALLSNAWDDLRQVLENEWNITGAFDELIISAEVGLAKPDERIYRLALERLAVAPREAVFVDDFPENVAAAGAIGMHAIKFINSEQVRAEINQLLNDRRPSTVDH